MSKIHDTNRKQGSEKKVQQYIANTTKCSILSTLIKKERLKKKEKIVR